LGKSVHSSKSLEGKNGWEQIQESWGSGKVVMNGKGWSGVEGIGVKMVGLGGEETRENARSA